MRADFQIPEIIEQAFEIGARYMYNTVLVEAEDERIGLHIEINARQFLSGMPL